MAIFLQHWMTRKHNPFQLAALEAVDVVLMQENHVLDRKREDRVEVTPQGIIIYSWGFDSVEVLRKQGHILAALEAEDLHVKDHGFFQDGTGLGYIEGVIEIPAKPNGGFEGILGALSYRALPNGSLQAAQRTA